MLDSLQLARAIGDLTRRAPCTYQTARPAARIRGRQVREDKIAAIVRRFSNAWTIGQLDDLFTAPNLVIEPQGQSGLVSEARRTGESSAHVCVRILQLTMQSVAQPFDESIRINFDYGSRCLAIPVAAWIDAIGLKLIGCRTGPNCRSEDHWYVPWRRILVVAIQHVYSEVFVPTCLFSGFPGSVQRGSASRWATVLATTTSCPGRRRSFPTMTTCCPSLSSPFTWIAPKCATPS